MSDTQNIQHTTYMELQVEKKPGSEIEITGEVPVESFESVRKTTIEKMRKELDLPGFRKGHVPADVALKHIGEQAVLQEVAEMAISAAYRDIITDEKLDVVGRPAVTVTKLAPGNPIGFKIVSAVFPEIDLPNYKKLAESERKNHDDPEKEKVDEKDIEEELKRLQKMLAGVPQEGEATPLPTEEGGDGEKKAVEEKKLPEINDDFARSLGEFKDLEDLKSKLTGQMLLNKKQKAYDKRRIAIADAIINKTKVEVPTVFIEGELDQMVSDFTQRVKQAGMEFDAYLKQADKTMEQIRKEWQPDAVKRAKLQLVLAEIAKKENITHNEEKLGRKVAHIKEHYPDAEEGAVRAYVSAQMINEEVFALLEDRKVVDEEEEGHEHDHDHAHETEGK